MKKSFFKIIIFVFVSVLIVSCSEKRIELDFSVIDSTFSIGDIEYPADYCKMQVLENPNDKNSKIIDLPVIRIRTNSISPGAPIFMLNDGPGLSNFKQAMPTWLAENHDIVIVGFRGVDGFVSLDFPELNRTTQNANFLSDSNIELAGEALKKGIKNLSDSLGIDVNNYNVVNMANDIEAARLAFAYPKINFFASGFGSRIAQVYGEISPNSVFRVLLERPKSYGTLLLKSQDIENILEFYNDAALIINNGKGFSQNIINGLSVLPPQHEKHTFDKDRIIYSAYVLMESNQGPAAINEAFLSAQRGDYDGLKYLEELYTTNYPSFNLGDYAIKCATSEYEAGKDYNKEFGADSKFAFGSPLAKFIYGAIQKSGIKFSIPDSTLNNPKESSGECLMVMPNLDITAPYDKAEFGLKNAYINAVSILLSDYNSRNLHSHRVKEYTELISNYLYVGDYKTYVPEYLEINLKPQKTFKQLYLERIQ
jgi:pimeloyl-ACP methyl ester carboxylesterase